MSRFKWMVFGLFATLSPLLGCGEKDLQDYSPTSGGSTASGGTTASSNDDAGSLGTGGMNGTVGTGGSTASSSPVYANDIDLLLKKYCASCHAAGATKPQMDTYATAKASASASNDTMIDNSMPPGPNKLTAAEKAHFDAWIKAGTPP